MSSVAIGHDNEGDFFLRSRWKVITIWAMIEPRRIYFYISTGHTDILQQNAGQHACLSPPKLIQIITIWGTRLNMSCCALGNLAMRSDTMITNDYDWNVIILIVADFLTVETFSTIITIATTDLKICWDLTRFIRLLYD